MDQSGPSAAITARVLDSSEGGLGVRAAQPLTPGDPVSVVGELPTGGEAQGRARVAGCEAIDGGYRIGLSFDELGYRNPFYGPPRDKDMLGQESLLDYYEVLQLSPNADPETIHRVYRIMAQRYHPDNQESGDEEAFKLLLRAYRILSDPEKRAAYDVEHCSARRVKWKVFDQPEAARGMGQEKYKRRGILSLLYTKRIQQPEQPHMTVMELEELLGCPREHLEFSLWYLKENGHIARTDNGRYSLTVKGVDQAEAAGILEPRSDRLLTVAPMAR